MNHLDWLKNRKYEDVEYNGLEFCVKKMTQKESKDYQKKLERVEDMEEDELPEFILSLVLDRTTREPLFTAGQLADLPTTDMLGLLSAFVNANVPKAIEELEKNSQTTP